MKKILFAGVAMAAFAGSALAADLARPPPLYKAPPRPIVAYNWTGCYIGGNVGGIWERDSTGIAITDPTAFGLAAVVPASFSYTRNGWLGGGQVGCNYQVTSFVVGIETDFDGARLNGGQTNNTIPTVLFPFTVTSAVAQNLSWIGTTRGRLGVAWDNVLFYGTAGIAYARVANSFTLTDSASFFATFASDSATQTGWTAGGGIEVGFGPWSVKGEALWYNLGNHTLSASCTVSPLFGGGPCTGPNGTFSANFENRGVIARIGLNYRFGYGSVYAKY